MVVTVAVACGGSSSDEGSGSPADSGTEAGGGSGADGGGSGGSSGTGGSGGSSATGGSSGSGGTGGSTGGAAGAGGSSGAAAAGGSGGSSAAAGSGGGTQACVPGDSKGCVGPGACTGYQVCAQDGTRYEPCICGAGGSGGGGGAGGSAGSAGAGGAAGTAGASGSAGAAGAGAEVSCGETTPADCPAGDVCCVVQGSPDTCTASGSCTCSGFGCTFLEVTCDGPEDCPGSQVCCGTFVQGPGPGGSRYTSVVCAATCDGGNERRLCHSDGDCSGQYSDCDPSTILPAPFQRCN